MSRLSLSTAQVDTITGSITCGEGEKYDSPLNARMDSSHIVYFKILIKYAQPALRKTDSARTGSKCLPWTNVRFIEE